MQGKRNYIGSIIWPFIRYDVLMPKQVKTDLFEWLYLSLVVHQNEQRGLDKKSYTKEVKDDVRHIIKQRFYSLLDDTIIDNIISTAEKDFTVRDESQSSNCEWLVDETFGFLDTYEDLFSSQVGVQKVFQDGICGDVVPYFDDDLFVQDAKKSGDCELQSLVRDRPSQEQIKNAYLLYSRLNMVASNQDDTLAEPDEFYDEDAEVDFVPEMSNPTDMVTKVGNKDMTNYSTHFIDNSRCEFRLEIAVYTDGETLYIDTPFNPDVTFKWINKRLPKARSVCAELDEYLKSLEATHIVTTTVDPSAALQFVYRKGVADQMTKCGDIYRLIEHLPDQYNDLKKLLIDIDKQFTSKHKSYFNALGTYLECLISPFVDRTDIATRQYYDYNQYCTTISYICKQLGVNDRPFLSENVFKNWRKGWGHLKADLASIFLANAKMKSNTKLYPSFVQDIFSLYDRRNEGSHYNPGMTYNYDENDIIKLFNVTRVLIELI
ncbi:MAG: hypothetical protein J1G01_03735 [Clostridiales bacterium]|nr:hypothetical protein [Clostridiales bacterium]